jgi:hypothetical protein
MTSKMPVKVTVDVLAMGSLAYVTPTKAILIVLYISKKPRQIHPLQLLQVFLQQRTAMLIPP